MRGKSGLVCGLAAGLACAASSLNAASTPGSAQVTSTTTANGTTTISGMPVPGAAVLGTGVISGVVTDGTTGAPIEGVLVQLVGGSPGPLGRPQMMTDARGRFAFTHLVPSDAYVVSASRMGYLDGGYKRAPGSIVPVRITLRDGEWFPKANVNLRRTASISGTVLDDQNDPVVGIPVRALTKVRVAGRTRLAAGPSTMTDDRGMYRFSGLAAGEYLVHVPSVQVTVSTDKAPPPATASPNGASVTAAAPDPIGILRGDPRLAVIVGHYATPPAGGGSVSYAMAYHPAARSMDAATPVSLEFGDQRQNIDVQLSLVPTFRVSGRVLGSAEGVTRLPVRLVPLGSEGLGHGAEAGFTTTDATGAFTFLHVPAGDYTLMANHTVSEFSTSGGIGPTPLLPARAATFISMSSSSVPGSNGVSMLSRTTEGPPVAGRVPVTVVDRNVDDVALSLITGVNVSGTFLWDGADALPNGASVPTVRLEPADGDLSLSLRAPGFRRPEQVPKPVDFTINGALPGKYFFPFITTERFSLESIEWRGQDLITSPLEVEGDRDITGIVIRMTSKSNSVTGSVRDGTGALASSGAVILFPASSALWQNFGLSAVLFKTASVIGDGTFQISRVVPGEYLIAAVSDEDRPKWVEADFLASISGTATRIQVMPGATVTQNLRITGGR
jgi:hypothetical protein